MTKLGPPLRPTPPALNPCGCEQMLMVVATAAAEVPTTIVMLLMDSSPLLRVIACLSPLLHVIAVSVVSWQHMPTLAAAHHIGEEELHTRHCSP